MSGAGGGAFPLFLQLSKTVFQLAEHVEPNRIHKLLIRILACKAWPLQENTGTHGPDDVLVSSLVGATLITGCRQRDNLFLPHQLQPVIESLGILLLSGQQ